MDSLQNTKQQNQAPLLIDLDGVVVNWEQGVLDGLKELFPEDKFIHGLSVESFEHYFIEKNLPEKYRDAIKRIISSEGFYANLKPFPEALLALSKIRESGIPVFICTKPDLEYDDFLCHSEKIQWVHENLGEWWAERTILTPDKTVINGRFLIDDHPEIKGVMDPYWVQLMFDKPYNKASNNGLRFTWNSVELLISMMRGER